MYQLIRDEEFLFPSLSPGPVFCDTETCINKGKTSGGLYGKIRLFQIYQKGWDSAVIFDCFFYPIEVVLDCLRDNHLVFHNASYDLHTINLITKSVWYPKELDDTLYLSRHEYYNRQKFDFYSCLKYADLDDSFINSINKKEEQKSDWSGSLTERQLLYSAGDVLYLEKLYQQVKKNKDRLVYNLDIESLKHAVKYSRHGMPINQEELKKLKRAYIIKLENTLRILPPDFNPRSSKQSCDYLGTKTSKHEKLIELSRKGDDKADLVLNARHYYKALEYLNSYDSKVVKGFFNPCSALSGRFSCTGGDSYYHVNLQQMPEYLHSVVQAPEGYHIVYKDYSGIELRMAVAYTGEQTMGSFMKSGKDMHTATAKFIFNKDEISPEERTVAKTFNFGLIYGAGVATIRNTLYFDANIEMSFTKVKDLINKWFNMYPYFKEWHNIYKKQFNKFGYMDVETALRRKVRVLRITDALNLPIQGSTVEVLKLALAYLHNKYPDVYLVNTIHDSNILLSKIDEVEMWGNRLSECMIDAWNYVITDLADPDIPMPGGFEHGPVWTFH